jgi:hypothetical protein
MVEAEIEITPEMIAAGVSAVSRINWEMDRFEEMAAEIYRAMESAKKRLPTGHPLGSHMK